MRVVHFLNYMRTEFGGPMRAVIDLCGSLASRGHPTTLLTYDDTDVPGSWKAGAGLRAARPTVQVLEKPLPGGVMGLRALAEARRVIAGADALHLHGAWDLANVQLASIARAHRVPYYITAHGMLDDWCMKQRNLKKRLFMSLVGKRMLEGAESVHLTAQAEEEQSSAWFPRGRASVMPYLVDMKPYRRLPGAELARERFECLRSGAPTMLFLSRLHYKKGIENLLHAARALVDRGVAFHLIIAGPGEPAYVKSLLALWSSLKLEGKVSFVGCITGDEKLSLYQASDLFVLPTSQENFGLVYTEALACGTPVVATRGVDIWRELEESGGGIITDAAPTALADTLQKALADRDGLRRMGRAARTWVLDWLDPQRAIRQYESMYARSVRPDGAAAPAVPAMVPARIAAPAPRRRAMVGA